MKKNLIYWLILGFVLTAGCQKEFSFEGGLTPAEGTLQSETSGDCLPKTVSGTYVAATALVPATNTISIQVDVTRTGSYTILTDTVNGYFFRGTGIFTTLGINTVTLRSSGTPFTAGINNFIVSFNSSVCDIAITVGPAGSGSPAVFSLAGTPGNCTNAIINGIYAKDVALNSSNTVTISVDVATIGTYNISTTFQGMTFAAAGTFVTPGPQTVTLNGSGTPGTVGSNTVPLTAGTTSCNFSVPVASAAAGTLGGAGGVCTPSTPNGIYIKDVALTGTNTVQVQIDVTTAGVYNVTTNTVAGFHFSGTGTVAVGPGQLIILAGGGTPTASGPQVFTVSFGTSTCTFTVNVGAGGTFTPDCSTAIVHGTYTAGTILDATNTVDIDINVTAIGPYTISTTPVNGISFKKSGTFSATGPATITLAGSGTPLTSGPTSIQMPGTTTCTFSVDVVAGISIDWQFTAGGPTTTFKGSTDNAQIVPVTGTIQSLAYFGSNANDNILFTLIDLAGGIKAGETYSTNATTTNGSSFSYLVNSGTDQFTTDATRNITFTVTSHNTTTKTIIGTFTGSVKNNAGTTRAITAGTFTAIYQ